MDELWTLYRGDCRRLLARHFAEASVDCVIQDPPYGIELMHDVPGGGGLSWDITRQAGKSQRFNPKCEACQGRMRGSNRCSCDLPRWDVDPGAQAREFGAWCSTWAGEMFRVLKPGGFAFVFASPKMAHRLTVALEDAGFEVRDPIVWLYASGVPKTPRMPAGFEGWATALKPAFEQIVVARRPLIGTIADNLRVHGVGALNVTACRAGDEVLPAATRKAGIGDLRWRSMSSGGSTGERSGRWPATVVFSHVPDCGPAGGCVPGCPGAEMPRDGAYFNSFRYQAKADTEERSAGLPSGAVNPHPTVKPFELMRWLVRLGCPPGGVLLDMFAGSGTTLAAALSLDIAIRPIGVEQDVRMVRVIDARCRHAVEQAKAAAAEGAMVACPPKVDHAS